VADEELDTQRYLADLDRTQGPIEHDPDDDQTEGPDDEEDEASDPEGEGPSSESGAPRINRSKKAKKQAKTAIKRVAKRNKGKPPTTAQTVGLVMQQREKAAAAAIKKTEARLRSRGGAASGGSAPMQAHPSVKSFERQVFAAFRKNHPNAVESDTVYYSIVEVPWTGEGTAAAVTCGLVLDPGASGVVSFKGFTYAIGETITLAGGNTLVVSAGRTNLQNPGQNLFPREVMVIYEVGLELAGQRIVYPAAAIEALLTAGSITANQALALKGAMNMSDDAGIFQPAQIYNEFTDANLLNKALFANGTLAFAWNKNAGRGATGAEEVIIKPLQDMMAMSGKGDRRGPQVHKLEEPYVWTQNQSEQGRFGVFETRINVYEKTYFPIKAVNIPSTGSLVVPQFVSLLYRLEVRGRAIRPAEDAVKINERNR
jgi:hypothetical protein